jgi:hypothetical protein
LVMEEALFAAVVTFFAGAQALSIKKANNK